MTPWARFVHMGMEGMAAWVMAVAAATLVLLVGLFTLAGIMPDSPGAIAGFFFAVLVYTAVLSAIPATLAVWTLRLTNAPRGWTDALAGALMGPFLSHAILGGFDFSPESFKLADIMLAVAGAAGGFAYWYFAGRPGRRT
ncbi:hypothetical protein L5876_11025 [Hyphobacterium sp. SN044]|uniref:hypothetical protein n=1 Tax=Hyphobacterium sp. SN044 TaxID=2912575 RepID=UPI001F2FC56F|nr:hypothetical protein [Hyphobacterium sp. SN044]MCF8880348.1 hypothetical protein [Hyphobacterium sp. SN044]